MHLVFDLKCFGGTKCNALCTCLSTNAIKNSTTTCRNSYIFESIKRQLFFEPTKFPEFQSNFTTERYVKHINLHQLTSSLGFNKCNSFICKLAWNNDVLELVLQLESKKELAFSAFPLYKCRELKVLPPGVFCDLLDSLYAQGGILKFA